ncbi:PAN domain-containing protein [Nitrobacter winogradskyi]|uniref:PAN domain-containing protein n=1 Tax=Nitrobacter winogradskyi TaxID=913 RepID=UPI0011419AE6
MPFLRLGRFPISATDLCQSHCIQTAACNSWTLAPDRRLCRLNARIPSKKTRTDSTSGVVEREFQLNTARGGGTFISTRKVRDARVCRRACEADHSVCRSWVFNTESRNCHLKSDVPGASNSRRHTSGVIRPPSHVK